MKYGIREICDVVFKAKTKVQIGKSTFEPGQPVIYFDTLKTSSMEGAATTVYAQGGKGNARLMAWEGERTVTFTMEDALISEMGLSVLTGAGLIDATQKTLNIHSTARFANDKKECIVYEKVNKTTTAPIYAIGLNENDDVIDNKVTTVEVTEGSEGKKTFSKFAVPSTFADNAEIKTIMFDFYVEKNSGAQ
jgi:hypothetical protein